MKARQWEVLQEQGAATHSVVEHVRTGLGRQLRNQELFWEDAAVSLRTGKPYKSAERDRIQRELVEDGLAEEEDIERNEALIEGIAAGEPVLIEDTMMVVTADVIEETIAAAPARRAALEQLLTPPEGVHPE